jgi:hypothetical protein
MAVGVTIEAAGERHAFPFSAAMALGTGDRLVGTQEGKGSHRMIEIDCGESFLNAVATLAVLTQRTLVGVFVAGYTGIRPQQKGAGRLAFHRTVRSMAFGTGRDLSMEPRQRIACLRMIKFFRIPREHLCILPAMFGMTELAIL